MPNGGILGDIAKSTTVQGFPGLELYIFLSRLQYYMTTMNFINGWLPRSHGKDAIFLMKDILRKYHYFIALRHRYSAKEVTKIFIQHVVHLLDMPTTIVSNRDPIYTSIFWQALFEQHSTLYEFIISSTISWKN